MATEAEVVAALALRCDAAAEPVVTTAELTTFVRGARRRDAAGLAVTDPLWAPTYDLAMAAVAVFELKAMRVTPQVDFKADGGAFTLSQLREGFHEMARTARRGVYGTLATRDTKVPDPYQDVYFEQDINDGPKL